MKLLGEFILCPGVRYPQFAVDTQLQISIPAKIKQCYEHITLVFGGCEDLDEAQASAELFSCFGFWGPLIPGLYYLWSCSASDRLNSQSGGLPRLVTSARRAGGSDGYKDMPLHSFVLCFSSACSQIGRPCSWSFMPLSFPDWTTACTLPLKSYLEASAIQNAVVWVVIYIFNSTCHTSVPRALVAGLLLGPIQSAGFDL